MTLGSLIKSSVLATFLCNNALAATIDESFCNKTGYDSAKRQTLLIVDGSVIEPEPDGKRKGANRPWREYVASLVNPEDLAAAQRFAPREYITIAIAEADGSGVTSIFSGCIPTYSKHEQLELDSANSAVGEFFGRGWKAELKKSQENFRRHMILSLVEGTVAAKARETSAQHNFSDSAIINSLQRGLPIAIQNGVPRLILYSDLKQYALPQGSVPTVRKVGRDGSERMGLNLQYTELHIIDAGGKVDSVGNQYLRSFFLAAKASVATLVGKNSPFKIINSPSQVSVYQGKIKYPDGTYPVRMRLALDRNGTAVNSWVEEISDRARFSPFGGVLTCSGEKKCSFIGDRIFAQIWSDNPDPEPQFENWMPFAGFREFEFTLNDGAIRGVIKDSAGYVPGMEDGLKFELHLVENGMF